MAIKVGGTEVVSNARQLSNIASVDATTVAALGAAGVGGGSTRDFTATNAITAGDIVSLLSDGTVSTTEALEYGSLQSDTSSTNPESVQFDVKNNVIVVVFSDGDNSNYGNILIGTISSGTITWGTPTVFVSTYLGYPQVVLTSDASHVIIQYSDFTASGRKAICGSISGTTASFGSIISIASSNVRTEFIRISDTSFFMADSNGNSYGITRSGTTLTSGSVTFYSGVSVGYDTCVLYDSTQGHVHVAFVDSSNNTRLSTLSVSGTTVTVESQDMYLGPDGGSGASKVLLSTTADSDTFLFVFSNDYSVYDYTYYGTYTYNGSSITRGTIATLLGGEGVLGQFQNTNVPLHLGNNNFVITSRRTHTVTDSCIFFTLIDGVVSEYLPVNNDIEGYLFTSTDGAIRAVKQDPVSSLVWKAGRFSSESGATGNNKVGAVNVTWADANPFNWVGIAEASVSDGATVTCTTMGGVNSNQTGLTVGRPFSISGIKVGTPLSATEVLITGADK